jgi:hypothetical protein
MQKLQRKCKVFCRSAIKPPIFAEETRKIIAYTFVSPLTIPL